MTDYTDKYCPICTGPLSTVGDCWIPCQYEATEVATMLKPLSKKEMLKRRIDQAEKELKSLKGQTRDVRTKIANLRLSLTTI